MTTHTPAWTTTAAIIFLGTLLGTLLHPALAHAEAAWQTVEELPRVDFGKLDKGGREIALQILRSEACTCGCGMKIAECLLKDQKCQTSPALAAKVVKGASAGQAPDAIIASLASVRPPAPPAATPVTLKEGTGTPARTPGEGSQGIRPDRLDLSGLTEQQVKDVMAILAIDECTCGCHQKLDQCLAKDLTCNVSPKMAAEIVQRIRDK